MATADFVHSVGNRRLLDLPKTAFLCSRRVPAAVVLKCFDWAIEQRETRRCVVSGFHSTIEKDVFHYLIKGTQPVVMMLAHGIGPKIKVEFADHLEAGRLLIASPFGPDQKRGDRRTAGKRNELMIDLADDVVVGYASSGGILEKTLSALSKPYRLL